VEVLCVIAIRRSKILKGNRYCVLSWWLCKRRVCNDALGGGGGGRAKKIKRPTNQINYRLRFCVRLPETSTVVQLHPSCRIVPQRFRWLRKECYCELPCRLHAMQERRRSCLHSDGEASCGRFSVQLECGAAPLGDRCPKLRNNVGISTIDNKRKYNPS